MSRKSRANLGGAGAFAPLEGVRKHKSPYSTAEASGHLEAARQGIGNLKMSPSGHDGSSSDLRGALGRSGARDRKDLDNMPIYPRMKYTPHYTTKDERKRRRDAAADTARSGMPANQPAASLLDRVPGTRNKVYDDIKECKNAIDMTISDLESIQRLSVLPNSTHETDVVKALNAIILEETRHLDALQRELRAMTPEKSAESCRSSGSESSMSSDSGRGARNIAQRDTAASRAPNDPDGPRAKRGSPTIHGFNKKFAAGYQST